jgi:hypothetical protein
VKSWIELQENFTISLESPIKRENSDYKDVRRVVTRENIENQRKDKTLLSSIFIFLNYKQ